VQVFAKILQSQHPVSAIEIIARLMDHNFMVILNWWTRARSGILNLLSYRRGGLTFSTNNPRFAPNREPSKEAAQGPDVEEAMSCSCHADAMAVSAPLLPRETGIGEINH
jgi:hypothetical protein